MNREMIEQIVKEAFLKGAEWQQEVRMRVADPLDEAIENVVNQFVDIKSE